MNDIIENILRDVVTKKTSLSSTPVKEARNLLKVQAPMKAPRSKSDIFENTREFCTQDRDHSQYTKLDQDYSHRPRVPGMDWAECPWAHPDDSLFPSSDFNVKP